MAQRVNQNSKCTKSEEGLRLTREVTNLRVAAKEMFRNRSTFGGYSVILYRNVYHDLPRFSYKKLVRKQQIRTEWLEKSAVAGILTNVGVNSNADNNKETIKKLLATEEDNADHPILREAAAGASASRLFDIYFEEVKKNPAAQRYYARDIESIRSVESRLDVLNSAHDPAEKIADVHTSMWYIGTFLSCTCLHDERRSKPSANLLLGGGWKLWLVIDRDDRSKLQEQFHNEMKAAGLTGDEDGGRVKDLCKGVLDHKIWTVVASKLNTLGIRYVTFIQKPGDLVYTRMGAYHFMVNLGLNIAEARNFEPPEWISTQTLYTSPCKCRDYHGGDNNNINHLVTVTTLSAKTLHRCTKCEKTFKLKPLLREHLKTVHNTNLCICQVCGKPFGTQSALTAHQICHQPKSRCETCGKEVADLRKHAQVHLKRKEKCSKCDRLFTHNYMKTHEKKCRLECRYCKKDGYKNMTALTNHEKRCARRN